MAKKSSKTAHVLNLISNPKHASVESETSPENTNSSEEIDNSVENNNTKEINIPPEINPTIKQSLEKAAKSEALSNAIKDSLEKEFNNTNTNGIDNKINTDNKTIEKSQNIYENTIDKLSENIETKDDLYINNEVSENDIEHNTIKNIEENSSKDNDKEFLFINVCEELVKENIDEYINRFNVCKCKRCAADAMALALSNLPPKYIVVNDTSAVPFLSFYENKYRILLMTELTKACLKIIESPRHNI